MVKKLASEDRLPSRIADAPPAALPGSATLLGRGIV